MYRRLIGEQGRKYGDYAAFLMTDGQMAQGGSIWNVPVRDDTGLDTVSQTMRVDREEIQGLGPGYFTI